jgi:putative transposase
MLCSAATRREHVFFSDDDYRLYRDLLREACDKAGVKRLGLLPDAQPRASHAHADGLARALGKTHRRCSGFVNARLRVTGHLFQSRFGSVVMDEDHLIAAARDVALNPVRARLVERGEDWPWSSARAHLEGRDDGLVEVAPLLSRVVGRFADPGLNRDGAGRRPDSRASRGRRHRATPRLGGLR